jgi:hypothetical protein
MKKFRLISFALLLLAAGCAATRITTSWKAKDAVPQKYNKIMILGLIRTADRSIQEKMENHMIDNLKDIGYSAVSSLQEYGPKAFDKMDEEAALAKLKSTGVDAVITIVLLNKEREKSYIPGHIYYYSPYGYYYNNFWGYRTALYHRIYEPGYYEPGHYVVNTRYFWESNLYDMSTQKLVYSVQTQSFDPANSESLAHEYGQLIIKNMVQQHVLLDYGNTNK